MGSVIWAQVIPTAPPASPWAMLTRGIIPSSPPSPSPQCTAPWMLPPQGMLLLVGTHSQRSQHTGMECERVPHAGTKEKTPLGLGGPSRRVSSSHGTGMDVALTAMRGHGSRGQDQAGGSS